MQLNSSLFTTSKMDRQLLRQKFRRRISVMKTNTLYVSRELAFWFTFVWKITKTPTFVFITEILWLTFWRNNWQSVFDVVNGLRFYNVSIILFKENPRPLCKVLEFLQPFTLVTRRKFACFWFIHSHCLLHSLVGLEEFN